MKKFEIKLLPNNESRHLNGLPIFYHFIYHNELMSKEMESQCYKTSLKTGGFMSYDRPNRLISTTINFHEIK